ncbi:MAG: ATP-dependent Clp protease proteolytic subunit [Candidatus Sulfotelmatobacter sp.]
MIHVIGEINEETARRYFDQAELNRFGSTVLISSPGGDIGYTLAMLDEIDENKRTTKATGFCQSAAAVLATAGEGKRICTADCLFRFMPPKKEKFVVMDDGVPTEIEKVPDFGNFTHSLLVARLAARLKTSIGDISLMFDGEFISSTRAKELGLIDEIIFTEAQNAERNTDRFPGSESQADGTGNDCPF